MCTISINVEPNNNGSTNDQIILALKDIINNQTRIMAAIDDLKTQVTDLQTQVGDLQTALDNEQAAIQQLLDTNASVVTDLNNQIATLQAQVAAGATPEQLQDLANSLSTISANIATTKADLEATVPDAGAPTTPTL